MLDKQDSIASYSPLRWWRIRTRLQPEEERILLCIVSASLLKRMASGCTENIHPGLPPEYDDTTFFPNRVLESQPSTCLIYSHPLNVLPQRWTILPMVDWPTNDSPFIDDSPHVGLPIPFWVDILYDLPSGRIALLTT